MRCFPDFMVEIAESAEEALEVVEDLISSGRELPLVIADQIMPNMRGDQFLIALHDRYPKIVKVMLTGQARAEDVGNVVNRGNLYRFMSKPWNENDLRLTVSEALRSYKQDRTIEAQYLALEQAKLELEILNANLEKQVQERTQQIRQSEVRYRILSEVVAVGLFRFDADGQCIYVNNRWCEMTGRAASVAMGMGWVETIHPEDVDQLLSDWMKAFKADGHYQGEARYLRPDGSIVWFYGEVLPEFDNNGKIISYVGSLTDISDRKKNEELLRLSEQKQRALIEALPDLVMRVSREGVYLAFYATSAFNVIGKTGDFIGTHINDSLPPDLATRRMNAIHNALLTKEIQIYEQEIVVEGILQIEECRVVACGEEEVLIVGRDISDRKRSEKALRESESHKAAIIRALPDLIMRIHKNGTYLEFHSTESFNVFGKAEDFVGKHLDKDLSPNIVAQRMKMINAALETGDIQIYEQEILVAGKLQTEEVRIVPYTEDEVLLLVRDISDRKQSELALQSLLEGTASVTGKEFFPELVKHIAIALDVSHVFISKLSGENLETMAWYADDLIQPNFTYPITDTPCERAFLDGIYKCSSGVRQVFSLDDDLVKMNVDNYLGTALQNSAGKKIGVICVLNHQPLANPTRAELLLRIFGARASAELERMQVFEDLQILNIELEQRVQERTKELSKARNFLEAIIENLPLSLFVKNGKEEKFGEFLLWNNTCELMFGCSKAQALGKSGYDFFPKEQSDFFNEKDRSSFALGKIEDIPEEPIDSLTLGRRILHTVKVPIFDEHGNPDYLICISEDISDRKATELERDRLLQELSQLNKSLELRVEERTAALVNAQERIIAQEKLASLGTLTAGIAHELRNPLNFVTNYALGSIELSQELLEAIEPFRPSFDLDTSDLVSSLIADLQENSSTIRVHSKRAENIITNMMQHARTNEVKALPQPTQINDLLDQSLMLAYRGKKIQNSDFDMTIQTDYTADLELVDLFTGAMSRAFINLIDNACDGMRYQKSLLIASKDLGKYQPTLCISTSSLGDLVEIRIRDNGCGISPETQSKILDPFFTTKPPGEGTGLGLSLTYDIIVKQHNGTLTINSNLSQFTEIIVTLPIRYT
jgi:PAS domain S-box-containing protein